LQCKLVVDLNQGLYFSDIDENCCKSFDSSLTQRILVNNVEPTISKEVRDFTLIETNFALAVLMIGILGVVELQKAEIYSNAFAQNPANFFIGRLPSFTGCGNGRIEKGEECDDGNILNDDFCSSKCKEITSGAFVPQLSSSGVIDLMFSDPFTGKIFSKEELINITKPNASNTKRIKLEKAVGSCVFDSICSNENNFNETTGTVKGSFLGNTIDRCLEANRDLLPPIVLENRQTPCNVSINIDDRLVSSTINKSCCTPLQENNLSSLISKDLRNFSLPETLIATLIFAIVSAVTLQFISAAKIRTDKGSSELDLEQQGRQAVELIVDDIKHAGLKLLTSFCDEHPEQCISGKPSKLNSLDTTGQEEIEEPTFFGSGVKDILDEDTVNKVSKIKISKDKLREFRANIEQYLALCTNTILCSNPDGVFEPNNEKTVNKEILSSTIDTCFNFAGFSLPSSSGSIETNQCKLDLDLDQVTVNGSFNKNCCSINDIDLSKRLNPDSFIEKELRNIALVFVLFALDVFSVLALTYLIDTRIESKMVSASRDHNLALYAAEAGIQEAITRLNLKGTEDKETFNLLDEIDGLNFSSLADITGQESGFSQFEKSDNVPDLTSKIDRQETEYINNEAKRWERKKNKLSRFLNTCFEQVLCDNADSVFKDGKFDKRILPAITNICLSRVGIALTGTSNAPCICTYKGCLCKPNAVCKSGSCADDSLCKCNDDEECLCPLNRVCEKIKCDENDCVCEDDLCNTDSDCNAGQTCNRDEDCDSGKMCDSDTRVCVVKQTGICKGSSECKSGELCNQGKCEISQSCTLPPPGSFAQNPCPPGQFCFFQDKKCWNISCITTADCPPANHICNKNICEFRP